MIALAAAVLILFGYVALRVWLRAEPCRIAPRLDGKIAVVTGCTSGGVGFHVAHTLARLGASVTLADRDALRSRNAAAQIRAETGNSRVVSAHCDLQDLRSVSSFARWFLEQNGGKCDVLVCNAGVMAVPRAGFTPQGFEHHFGVNVVGHLQLALLLLPALSKCRGRVLFTGSRTHWDATRAGGIRMETLRAETAVHARRKLSGMAAYSQSKMALIMLSREFHNHFHTSSGVSVFCVDPGAVRTEITRHYFKPIHWIWKTLPIARKPFEGAQTAIYCSVVPLDQAESGLFWQNCAPATPSAMASDPKLSEALWNWTTSQISKAVEH